MRKPQPKPQPKTLPVIKIPLRDDAVALLILFEGTRDARFALYALSEPEPGPGPGPGKWGGPSLFLEGHASERVFCTFLGSSSVWPGAQFALLVHEIDEPDHEPEGSVIFSLVDYDGPLPNGYIKIDIPRGQVALRHIEFVDGDGENGDEEG